MRLRAILRCGAVLLCVALPAPGLADALGLGDDWHGTISRQLEQQAVETLERWRDNREKSIAGLEARGATHEEAVQAIDSLIASAEAEVAESTRMLTPSTPQTEALEEKLAILAAVSNLRHERFLAFAAKHDLTVAPGFLNCLCQSYSHTGTGIGYSPEPGGDCQNTLPCKGGNWGCVAHDLPTDPVVWSRCAAAHAGDARPLTDQIADAVRGITKRYNRDVCARLRTVLDETKDLIRTGVLKPVADSPLATGDFEKTFFDMLAGRPVSGAVETLLSGASDRLALATGLADPNAPTGLAVHLTDQDLPSNTGFNNPYVLYTKAPSVTHDIGSDGLRVPMSYEMALAHRIMTSGGDLTPGDVFRMAVEVSGGDVPLAGLIAHNLLKEAAYAHRRGQPLILMKQNRKFDSDNPDEMGVLDGYLQAFGRDGRMVESTFILPDPDVIRSKLQDIRPLYDPHAADRLGPWYHTFGLIFVGTNPALGEGLAYSGAAVENATRLLRLGSGRSLGKEAANMCAAVLISLMNRNMEAASAKP